VSVTCADPIGTDPFDPRPAVDVAAATTAAADLLRALGADLTEPSVAETPARIARAYAELLTPRPFTMTTFPNDEGYDELVLARAIPFSSLCEHHALPFIGVAHVGYIPDGRILGLSKLARASQLPLDSAGDVGCTMGARARWRSGPVSSLPDRRGERHR
jgi:GTP cyclohydrolase I